MSRSSVTTKQGTLRTNFASLPLELRLHIYKLYYDDLWQYGAIQPGVITVHGSARESCRYVHESATGTFQPYWLLWTSKGAFVTVYYEDKFKPGGTTDYIPTRSLENTLLPDMDCR